MSEQYDVIVVGAGPAGSSCALHLAEKNINVLLVDKKRFPREKFCGGGVPGSVFIEYQLNPRRLGAIPIRHYIFSCRGERGVAGAVAPKQLYSVVRSRFDFNLAQKAVKAGVTFLDGCNVKRIEEGDSLRVIAADGSEFRGRFLVGADGGTSLVARTCLPADKGKERHVGTCCYYELNAPKDLLESYRNSVHLDFNFFPGGVVGVLPKEKFLWVGAYIAKKCNLADLQNHIRAFMAKFNLGGETGDYKGLYFPLYRRNVHLARKNILLAGEAAGLVNTLSGEGIKPALDSGKIAAEEIENALRNGSDLRTYSERIHKEIGNELLMADRFSRIAYQFPDIAYEGMIRVADDALRILNGALSYESFFQRLKAKIKRKLWLGKD